MCICMLIEEAVCRRSCVIHTRQAQIHTLSMTYRYICKYIQIHMQYVSCVYYSVFAYVSVCHRHYIHTSTHKAHTNPHTRNLSPPHSIFVYTCVMRRENNDKRKRKYCNKGSTALSAHAALYKIIIYILISVRCAANGRARRTRLRPGIRY